MTSQFDSSFLQSQVIAADKISRILQVSSSSYFYQLNTAPEGSTTVVSAIGACIACVVLLLIVLTAYMAFRVYKQGKQQVVLNGQQAEDNKNPQLNVKAEDKEEKYIRMEREKLAQQQNARNQDIARNQQLMRNSQKPKVDDEIELDIDDEEIANQQRKNDQRNSAFPGGQDQRPTAVPRSTVQSTNGFQKPENNNAKPQLVNQIEQAQRRKFHNGDGSSEEEDSSYEEDQSKMGDQESESENEMPQVAQHNIIAKAQQQQQQQQQQDIHQSAPQSNVMKDVQNQRQNQFKKEKVQEYQEVVSPVKPHEISIDKKSQNEVIAAKENPKKPEDAKESEKQQQPSKQQDRSFNKGGKQEKNDDYEYDEYYDEEENGDHSKTEDKEPQYLQVQKNSQKNLNYSSDQSNSFNNGKVSSSGKAEKENRPSKAERGQGRP